MDTRAGGSEGAERAGRHVRRAQVRVERGSVKTGRQSGPPHGFGLGLLCTTRLFHPRGRSSLSKETPRHRGDGDMSWPLGEAAEPRRWARRWSSCFHEGIFVDVVQI